MTQIQPGPQTCQPGTQPQIQQSLVGSRVLNDDFGLPVDGQDQGMAGLAQTIEQLDRVALEVARRSNVVGHAQIRRLIGGCILIV